MLQSIEIKLVPLEKAIKVRIVCECGGTTFIDRDHTGRLGAGGQVRLDLDPENTWPVLICDKCKKQHALEGHKKFFCIS